MTRSEKRYLVYGGLSLLLFTFCLAPEVIIGWLGIASAVIVGWVSFIRRVVPQVRINYGLVGSAAVYVALLLAGAHFFLRWLYREMRATTAPPTWRFRWTLGGFLLVVLMFTSGMAAIGAAHQTAWLVLSREPLLQPSRGREAANRVRCGSNFKQIGQALTLYANDHGGKFPDDLPPLLEEDITAAVFVCPSSNDEAATGATTQAVAADLATPHHCSYIYLGKGLSQPIAADRVIALEPLDNHQRKGIHVLFGDTHIEWLEQTEAEALLIKLGITKPATRATAPTTRGDVP